MILEDRRQKVVQHATAEIFLPDGIAIRAWREGDFGAIQRLSAAEGWPTPENRPDAALAAWRVSWPALVLTVEAEVIGFLRALTDGQVTTYIAEILVAPAWRGHGLGHALLQTCHCLCPSTRLDLLSTEASDGFYTTIGFRRFQGFRRSVL